MGVQPVVQSRQNVHHQVVAHQVPKKEMESPLKSQSPQPREGVRNGQSALPVQLLPPTPEQQEKFLAQIYTRNKQSSSVANLKAKDQHHHRGSLVDRSKKNRVSKAVETEIKMEQQGQANKENITLQQPPADNRKIRSVNSCYQCTIQDCEDELMAQPQ